MQPKGQMLLFFLATFFIVSNIMTAAYNTITVNGGTWLIFTYGTFIFMFGKSALDIIQEFWGKALRKQVTLVALIMKALIFGFTVLGLAIGNYSAGTREFLFEFPRVMIAGEITLLIGQYYADPYVYTLSARLLKGRSPFVRGVLSNITSSLILSFPYAYIAFFGDKPTAIVNKIAFGKIALKFPTILFASMIAAIVIFIVRKTLKMTSLIETGGVDHDQSRLSE